MINILATVEPAEHALHFGSALLPLALMFFAALLFVAAANKWKQSPVLAQLTAGIGLATILIAVDKFFGTNSHSAIMENPFIEGFAEFGVVILLLEIGMHSSVHKMKKVGGKATAVALTGVILPIIAGVGLAKLFNIGNGSMTAMLFLAAAMTATSVALSVSVLGELGLAKTAEGETVKGAAVIDDILGLVLLALVAGMAVGGGIDVWGILMLVVKAAAFVLIALAFGGKMADATSKIIVKFVKNIAGEISFVMLLTLTFAGIAYTLGLEPIIGAFTAGLILEETHLKRFGNDRSLVKVEKVVEWLMVFFVPIFFVRVGMLVDVFTLTPGVLLVGGVISVAAIITKYIAGYAARGMDHAIIGWSMVPRGEVGLVFAAIGASLGVFSGKEVAIILTMVIVTTFVAPYGLRWAAKKAKLANAAN